MPHLVMEAEELERRAGVDGAAPLHDLLDVLFANSPEAIVVVDEDGTIRYSTLGVELLLGHVTRAAVGRSIFEYLHPDDVAASSRIFERRLGFDGNDLGHVTRVRRASGDWLPMVVNAAVLPDPALGALAITIRTPTGAHEIERSLRQRVAIGEYCNGLSADFLELTDPDAVSSRLCDALAEVALLTGADMVDLVVEHRDGDRVERFARWTLPEFRIGPDGPLTVPMPDSRWPLDELLGTEVTTDEPDRLAELALFGGTEQVRPVSLMSAPLVTSGQRGALRFMRGHAGPAWSDADAELARTVAGIFARALRTARSDRLLSLTYREGPLGFSIRTLDGTLVDCNRQYLKLLGVGRADAERHGLEESIVEPHRSRLSDGARRLRSGEIDELSAECEYERPDGSRFWARTNTVQLRVPGSSERFLLTSVEDITENQAQRLELEFAARHDPLTGVANRNELANAIERHTRHHGEAPALVAIDLDRFKVVNDAFGHIVGDEVLKVVAERIVSEVRSDDVVARLGGDEFAVVAPRLDAEGAAHLAERLLERFAEPIDVEGARIEQRSSIGIALGEGRADGDDLLVRADRALYAAKQRGRDGYVLFDDSMEDAVLHRLELERDLRVALDRSQLDVHFQPEFSLADGHILGVEALLRWEHPDRGRVPADEFIVVAEQSGLIAEIGRFALHTACREFRAMVDELGDDELVLRINISAREFARPELPDVVASALAAAGLPARRLCLEMTETTLMDAPELALVTFAHLQDIGVMSAIDDFGTGYSSLSYLKRFPVDCVKIDRAFVEDVGHDPDTRAIVESIMGLAEAMDLEVVAEGVETEEQMEVLRQLGCERAQGYLVSGALPAGEVAALIRRRRSTEKIDAAAVG